jgi:hypothetical protein
VLYRGMGNFGVSLCVYSAGCMQARRELPAVEGKANGLRSMMDGAFGTSVPPSKSLHLSCESLALCIIPQTLARIGIAKPFTASRAMRRNLGWSGSRKARKSRVVLSGLCVSVL